MFSNNYVINKSQKAFLRKLYLAHLLDEEQHNLLSLQKLTQMPRRTLQDAIAAFVDIGIEVDFVQQGQRHNDGYYRISTWGPISSAWVNSHFEQIKQHIETIAELERVS
ncbi:MULTISPECIES: winged helix-turn-helix domain-containing protein [Shewanella]|uniref:winged helix-turn-helix domain-containing protein n=1 Tax=Shewanella TaxID=22 RepID=UPI000C687E43|nr:MULTISPECIES: winged helix-turn-helix domain-containing protein [Shewanella]NCQ46332.1 helix-turn-helix domain-containing protein [Shewanella frigidimarina]MBB1388667.1 helix-turn-helix domain-containing protein [Shewanella sp. SG44-6]NCO72832.1 helix-turn-helix domain-containing protein [Shewanella vesiculosa]NCP37944.1 helix-turn-helix domain-containing protein [Shewanella vesiculosa]NCP70256.1 helix-turn-helix domain-containing protein [Shewanella vesiculosa]